MTIARRFAIPLVALIALANLHAHTAQAAPMSHPLSWSELDAMPYPAKPGQRIPYGASAAKFGELRLPDAKRHGKGPYPVLVMIHGGCWLADYDYAYFTRLAAWVSEQGWATWNIEYRRLSDPGGGWPNTFMDVGEAADALYVIAKTDPVDLKQVYAAGHSAGGQLALWLASRGKLPNDSELARSEPLKIRGVLGLAAITDLASYRVGPAESCNASVDKLLDGTPQEQPRRYAETSPLARLPLGVPQVLVQGALDTIVPPAGAQAYVEAAVRAGDAASLVLLPEAGHFEPAVPHPASEAALRQALQRLRQ